MKIKFIYITVLGIFLTGQSLAISPADYAERFVIDMNAEIPPLDELAEKYTPPSNFDRKFDYYWKIGSEFDKSFARTIKEYGTRQKRLKWEREDEILEGLKSLPAEFYPYIGPYLHTLPGIPESVLNMPGIKETKNKFPERIAPQLADIENIEFLSPAFYFLLMPELWNNNDNIEQLRLTTIEPSNRYDANYMDKIVQIVPPADFAPGVTPKEPLQSKLRTISPDANSPLTSKDIQAFTKSLKALEAFSEDLYNQAALYQATVLLDLWENEQGKGGILPMIKDTVHPCQRLVQKVKMTGQDKEFAGIIAKEGFNLEEWAYTCDKTIKAYRLLRMTQVELLSVMLYKKNIYENQLNAYDEKIGPSIAITMQSYIEMYKAPLHDMLEVKKNEAEIKDAFETLKYRIGSQPIFIR